MKKSIKTVIKAIKYIFLIILIFLTAECLKPTWTPGIRGDNSISELRKVKVNGTSLEVLIRGSNKANPVVIFVHGGPCCSEIPFVRKYQDMLEKNFTIVHYDQRGSGKSYRFGTDYSEVTAGTHVEDLIAFTKYIEEYLGKDKVILIGYSYGTYIASIAAQKSPQLYSAYVGIGQMSDTIESELDGLHTCMKEAKAAGNEEDYAYLQKLEDRIAQGEIITPRQYVRKYGGAARLIDDNKDYVKGFFFGTEYNLLDAIRFNAAASRYQEALIQEALDKPVTRIADVIDIPVYFIMGKYDCMTSPKAAGNYLKNIKGEGEKKIIIFDKSAHYPQFEEKEKFYQWMCGTFLE